jgi:hypothetical protein
MRSIVVGRILSCAVVLCGPLCATASGEVGVPAGTVEQAGAGALFEEYAPPPPTPGVLCLVDSGVDQNPDTTPILAGSYALSPNTGTGDELAALNPPLPGGHPDGHGTYMAMLAASPINGWGMVGIAPSSVRVYNLKALAAGQTTFAFSEYATAINRCQALSSSLPITVVNLSLGSGTQPTGSELGTLENYVSAANAHGLSVVAAAGNEDSEIQAPASVPGVLAIGASDASLGGMCAFSNHGVGLSLLAPGCGSHTGPNGEENGIEIAFSDDGSPAWAEGTSEAADIVSAAEVSMRAYAPTLTLTQAQDCITSTLTNGVNLNVAAAFSACGLGQIVSEGMAAYRAANSTTPTKQPSSGLSAATLNPTAALLPAIKPAPEKPKIFKILFKKHRLRITVAAIPKGLRLQLVIQRYGRSGRFITLTQIITTQRTTILHVNGWDRIVARFLDGHTALPDVILTRTVRHKQTLQTQGP